MEPPCSTATECRKSWPRRCRPTLQTSTAQLPLNAAARKRSCTSRTYAVWSQPAKNARPKHSSHYTKEKPQADAWLDANARLIDRLSEDLRVVAPDTWMKFHALRRALPRGITPLCNAWLGCAVKQRVDDVHGTVGTQQDYNDDPKGFKCVVAFGDYEGGDLLLWQLKLRIQLRPGDVVMFNSALLAHNSTEVKGERGAVEFFTRKGVVTYKRKQMERRVNAKSKGMAKK